MKCLWLVPVRAMALGSGGLPSRVRQDFVVRIQTKASRGWIGNIARMAIESSTELITTDSSEDERLKSASAKVRRTRTSLFGMS